MPFGYLLKRFRDEKGLSQRKLGEIAGIHHAHIDRLENREKSPTQATVEKLTGALGLAGRDAWLLGFVASHRKYITVEMIEYTLAHPEISEKEFNWAVGLKFRMPELAYPKLFDCTRLMINVAENFLRRQKYPRERPPTLSGVRQ